MTIRHPRGNIKQTLGYVNVEFGGQIIPENEFSNYYIIDVLRLRFPERI